MIRACGIVLAAVVAAGASPNVDVGGGERRFEYAEPHMGTLVRIAFYARDEDAARRGSAAAFARIARLDETLSDYRDASELTQVSRASGSGPIVVGSDLFRVLEAAQRFARASGGAFDVTAGPLSVLWRQARRQQRLPDAARLAEARDRVGFDRMTLDAAARTVTLRDAGMQLDLGGIAKGFAADEALEALAAAGITRALVAAGGDVAAAEPPPGERGWRVTIATIAAKSVPSSSW